jgi:hydrogenase-4 component B
MDWITLEIFAAVICLCFVFGSLMAFLWPRPHITIGTNLSLVLALLGGLTTTAGAISFWGRPSKEGELIFAFPSPIQNLPPLSLELFLDRLGIFFLLLTGIFIVMVSLYSLDWLQKVRERHRIVGVYNLFALFTLFTILANNVYFFLVFLETMALAFGYLILYRHNTYLEEQRTSADEMERAKTAFKAYLIFSHVGIMLIAAALLVLSVHAESFDFDDLRKAKSLSSAASSTIFLLALFGLGIKAGMVPTHVWVSLVHPQSPTSIHAMMSGVILKVAGIYGMVRVFFEFLEPIQWWWGWLLILLAGGTALVGVFYALLAHDLKTTLASHSVENIGIILAGMGLALLFSTTDFAQMAGLSALAGLALVASLYHTLNHAIFKGLLFFCAGAVEDRTGTVEFEKLDGLMKLFPWTGAAFLVGAVSIAGFPPFNGFVSEWLTLQSLFAGVDLFLTQQRLPLLVGLLIALFLLGSAFGLTALAFVKILGEVFLGPPRQPDIIAKAKKGDVPWKMRSVLIALSVLCLLLGLFPSVTVGYLGEIAGDLGLRRDSFNTAIISGVSLSVPQTSDAVYVTRLSERVLVFIAIILLLPIGGVILWQRRNAKKRRFTSGPIWTCGAPYDPASMQFTGSALTSLVWGPFGLRPARGKRDLSRAESRHLPYRMALTAAIYVSEFFLQSYDWIAERLLNASQVLGAWFQNGDIRRYLWFIFGAFAAVLIALLLLVGGLP